MLRVHDIVVEEVQDLRLLLFVTGFFFLSPMEGRERKREKCAGKYGSNEEEKKGRLVFWLYLHR